MFCGLLKGSRLRMNSKLISTHDNVAANQVSWIKQQVPCGSPYLTIPFPWLQNSLQGISLIKEVHEIFPSDKLILCLNHCHWLLIGSSPHQIQIKGKSRRSSQACPIDENFWTDGPMWGLGQAQHHGGVHLSDNQKNIQNMNTLHTTTVQELQKRYMRFSHYEGYCHWLYWIEQSIMFIDSLLVLNKKWTLLDKDHEANGSRDAEEKT